MLSMLACIVEQVCDAMKIVVEHMLWITYDEIMLWFFVCNIMLTDMLVKNTSSSSLAFINGFHFLFEAELQANHNADLYTTLAWLFF